MLADEVATERWDLREGVELVEQTVVDSHGQWLYVKVRRACEELG